MREEEHQAQLAGILRYPKISEDAVRSEAFKNCLVVSESFFDVIQVRQDELNNELEAQWLGQVNGFPTSLH